MLQLVKFLLCNHCRAEITRSTNYNPGLQRVWRQAGGCLVLTDRQVSQSCELQAQWETLSQNIETSCRRHLTFDSGLHTQGYIHIYKNKHNQKKTCQPRIQKDVNAWKLRSLTYFGQSYKFSIGEFCLLWYFIGFPKEKKYLENVCL